MGAILQNKVQSCDDSGEQVLGDFKIFEKTRNQNRAEVSLAH